MVRKNFMLVAGEPSGDLLGAELVPRIRARLTRIEATPTSDYQPLRASLEPDFFGAGGAHLRRAGADVCIDLEQHAVVGLWEVVRKYREFLRLFRHTVALALRREPDVIVCIDFSGFNLRFGHAIRRYVRTLEGTFANWRPRLVQYVSPQVWASRPERARQLAEDFDLVLSVIPFEKAWYAKRVPELPVEFVGHPLVDRYPPPGRGEGAVRRDAHPHVVLLPGSRAGEVRRHLPVLLDALTRLKEAKPPLRATLVWSHARLRDEMRDQSLPPGLRVETGNLESVLTVADLALASTGTVLLECAYFGVPTVALYRTSWATYQVGKRLVQVNHLAMPNLLAGEEIFPEFIQDAATPENLARAALELLNDAARRAAVKASLARIVQSLGPPGASDRAAAAIVDLLESEPRPLRAFLTQR